jgi:1-deoxy-D-xylulose-5-phosphate synthase
VATLKTLRTLKGPKLLHVMTTKGKGYERAEGDQIGYHAVGPFDPDKGLIAKGGVKKPTYTDIFSDWLCDAAAAEPRLLGITPAMREGSGLVRFSKEYPDRYHDVAIAEQHAVTLAAGMACEGAKPVVAIYSTFLQRGYDQLVHDVAIQKLDVLFAIDRGGVVGPDGATHAGNLDLSLPALRAEHGGDGPVRRERMPPDAEHRLPVTSARRRALSARQRPGVPPCTDLARYAADRQGRACVVQGSGHCAAGVRRIVPAAEAVGEELGLSVVNMRFVKPLDRALLLDLAKTHEGFVTIEDNVVAGGAGSGVAELLNAEGVLRPSCTWACRTASSTTRAAKTCWLKRASMRLVFAPRC